MSDKIKYLLPEAEIPKNWYKLIADLPEPTPAFLYPGIHRPVSPDDLARLLPMSLIMHEVSDERYLEIPKPVSDIYKQCRSSPIFQARRLGKALDTSAKIYYKYEVVSPPRGDKPNTAVPQAFYNAEAGFKKIITETGTKK